MKALPSAFYLALIITGSSLFCGMSQADHTDANVAHWEDNLDKAREIARKQHKPILFLFTGTQWCGVCQLLEKNVLSKPEFADYVKNRVILVKAEFPIAYFDRKPDAPPLNADQQAQVELAKRFDVNVGQPNVHGLSGYPSLFLLSPEGEKLEQINTNIVVSQGTVESFLKSLDAELAKHSKPLQSPSTQAALFDSQRTTGVGGEL
jgi:protein disulfide-isomerase